METKTCRKCQLPLPLDAYYYDQPHDRYLARCKACVNAGNKASREKHREARKRGAAAYRKRHQAEIRAKQRAYHASAHGQARSKAYYVAHREKLIQQIRAREQLPSYKARKRAYRRRRKADPLFRIERSLRGRLRDGLRGARCAAVIDDLTGCSLVQLRAHLESLWQPGMSWANYGYRGWHIDHIIPVSAFNLSIAEERRVCFHWTNLRPMWAKDNVSKGDKVERGGKVVRGRDIRPQLIAWNGPGPIRYCRPPANWVA